MDQHTLINWIGVILLFSFGVTMIIQGHFIFHGKYGYKHSEREKQQMLDMRKRVEDLMKKESIYDDD